MAAGARGDLNYRHSEPRLVVRRIGLSHHLTRMSNLQRAFTANWRSQNLLR